MAAGTRRASRFLAAVAVALAPALVATAAPAWADATDECGLSYICKATRWDPGVYVDILDGYDEYQSWALTMFGLFPSEEENVAECEARKDKLPQDDPGRLLNCHYKTGTAPVLGVGGVGTVRQLGTQAEVQAGSAMRSMLCQSGTGCLRSLAGGGMPLTRNGGPEDAMPDGQDPETGKFKPFGPGRSFPATNMTSTANARVTGVFDGAKWVAGTNETPTLASGDWIAVEMRPEPDLTVNAFYEWRASLVNKTTGEWLHNGGTGSITLHQGTQRAASGFDPSGTYDGSQYELRSIDVVGDRPVPASTVANGWAFGQRFLPEGSVLRSTVRCQRPDGSEHDVVGQSLDVHLHRVDTPACPAGEHPLYSQLDVITPDNTVIPQSTTNLRPGWDRTMTPSSASPFPLCANGVCHWIVKVGDTWCARGVAGCTDWTQRPEEAKCFLGPYELPLTRCGHLERVYENNPQRIPATDPNTDGKPNTHEGPAPQRQPDPNATPKPGPTTNPNPNPNPSPSPSPSPSTPGPTAPPTTPTKPPPSAACASPYSLGPVQPEAVTAANEVGKRYSVSQVGGYRDPRTDNYGEHSTGLALDFMVGTDTVKGGQVASYLVSNADRLGVRWVIWNQRVYNVEKADAGWRAMEDRGSPTANHKDHVHALLYDTDGEAVSCAGDPLAPADSGDCWPNGWSWNPKHWVYDPVVCAMNALFIPEDGFFEQQWSARKDALNNSAIGSWANFLGDIGTGFDSLGGGANRAAFRALTADNDVYQDSTVYNGARIAAVPTVQDPGTGGPEPEIETDYTGLPWAAPGGALCQGPGVDTAFLGDKGYLPSTIYPFSACEGATAKAAAVSRIVLTAYLAYTVLWTTLQTVAAGFGLYIPSSPIAFRDDDGSNGGLPDGHVSEIWTKGR